MRPTEWAARLRSLRRIAPAAVIATAGLGLASLSYWLSFDYFEAERIHHEYEEPAARHVAVIDRAVSHPIDGVHSIGALYAVSAHAGRSELAAFVERSRRVNPGILGQMWEMPQSAPEPRPTMAATQCCPTDMGGRSLRQTSPGS